MNPGDKLRDIAKKVDNVIETIDFDFLLKEIPEQIKTRTRLGKGVPKDQSIKPLPKLSSEPYIRKRTMSDELNAQTRPKKSNLTFTGQLLDAIYGVKTKIAGGLRLTFKFKDERKKMTGQKTTPTNSQIAGYVEEQGRRFFDLSKSERARFSRIIVAKIQEALSKII